ncbi:MAG: J domain-containing protein [Crocinitomicaceae bacterium]|nr:J domain-containing protein [Crocinitomicaceae bacterium]
MQKNKYYKILKLEPGATDKEIRKQYRLLALKVHPDHNSSPAAEEEFIRLTEAQDILLGKKKLPSSYSRSKSNSPTQTTEAEKEIRKQEAKKRYTEQIIKDHIENELYFRKLTNGRRWKALQLSALFGALLALLLSLDLILPNHYQEEDVVGYRRNLAYAPNGQQISLVKTGNDDYFWISRITFSLYGRSRRVLVESSWVFHNAIRLISREKLRNKSFDIHFSFYAASWILIPLFLVPAFTLWYKRKKISFTVLYHFSMIGINALIIYFIFTDNRWAHLLTLGFL